MLTDAGLCLWGIFIAMPAETDPFSFLRQDQKRVAVCFGQCSGWLNNHLSRGISAMKFWHNSFKKGLLHIPE